MKSTASIFVFIWIVGFSCVQTVLAELEFEREPINYSKSEPSDVVHDLVNRMTNGKTTLEWDNDHGYLKSLLKLLKVPVDSQTLVFSKTSLQVHAITHGTPRAIYFNDDVYIGWVQNGDLIEVSVADPKLGTTFYTVEQDSSNKLPIKRETSRCLHCHASTHTRRVPGHIMRSVYPDSTGLPAYRLGTHRTNHTSPFQERWGGWYVTGTHGKQRHMGNVFLEDVEKSESLNLDRGANITDLSRLFDTSPYLSSHSDIVALMVLQHQTQMHNVLTAANISGRFTERDAQVMNKILERDAGFESESTQSRYDSAARKVVEALLFKDESLLKEPVTGTSKFTTSFSSRGPFDSQQRSLRQFDLNRRLFRYPCSFLIYSDSFKNLPKGVLDRVIARLDVILSGNDPSEDFDYLSDKDLKAIREILNETTEWTFGASR